MAKEPLLGRAGLTPKQERFCREYLVDHNGKRAATSAGYSAASAEVAASKLLRVPKVRAKIDELEGKQAQRLDLTADRVLGELMRVAFSDVGQVFDEQGRMRTLDKIPEDVRRAVAGVEAEELFEGRGEERQHVGTLRKVKLWNKNEALIALGKHLKLFIERVEQSGPGGGPIQSEIVIRDLAAERRAREVAGTAE